MGLKISNYEVKEYGLTVPEAYGIVSDVSVRPDGTCFATIAVQQSREAAKTQRAFERHSVRCQIDKSLPLYEQIYNEAKKGYFKDWEDDIPTAE